MERLRYIDATKGILILLVIAGHVPFAMVKLGGIPSSAISLWGEINYNTFASFYMASFFFITGYCSNFNKPLDVFIKDNLATLILPCLLLSSPTNWFIMALFLSKLLYYWLNSLGEKYMREKSKWIIVTICIVFSLLGCICRLLPERMSCWHALGLLVFLHIGQLLKGKDLFKIGLYSGLVYTGLSLWAKMCFHIPSIASDYLVELKEWPLHLILALSGSLFILSLGKIFQKSNILCVLGKNSLIIYFFHVWILRLLSLCTRSVWEPYADNFWVMTIIYIAFIGAAAFLSYIIARILSTKQLCWILGKYDYTNK